MKRSSFDWRSSYRKDVDVLESNIYAAIYTLAKLSSGQIRRDDFESKMPNYTDL